MSIFGIRTGVVASMSSLSDWLALEDNDCGSQWKRKSVNEIEKQNHLEKTDVVTITNLASFVWTYVHLASIYVLYVYVSNKVCHVKYNECLH